MELQRSLAPLGEIVAGRLGRAAILPMPQADSPTGARCSRPTSSSIRAAYTAVDKAETDRSWLAVNAVAPGILAKRPRGSAPWSSTTPPTTSSTAPSGCLCERRCHQPAERLRPHQARRRTALGQRPTTPPDLAHQLGLRRAWRQLCQDHAQAGGRARQPQRRRRPVRRTHLGSAARRHHRPARSPAAREPEAFPCGIYHCVAGGETTWYDYARFVIGHAIQAGKPLEGNAGSIRPITTADYPTPARRRPIRDWIPASSARPSASNCRTGSRASNHILQQILMTP